MSGTASWSGRWLCRLQLLRAFVWSWVRRPERALRALDAVDGGFAPPWGTAVLSLRGRLLDVVGRKTEAEAAYAEGVRLEPQNPETHTSYGEALMAWGRLEEAGRELRRARELGPPSPRLERALAAYAAVAEAQRR